MAVRQKWSGYFYWLVFSGMLFIASEVLRNAEAIRFDRMYWLDVAASYALLGALGTLAAWLGSVLLTVFDVLALHLNRPGLRSWPSGIVFACFVVAWLNLVRLMLAANHLKLNWSPLYQSMAFFVIGMAVFIAFHRPLMDWMTVTTHQLRPIVKAAVLIYLVLTVYLLLEPLNKGKPASVALADPDRKLPNVIIIVLDSLTTRDMSPYGYHLQTTPNLDRMTKTWTVYQNAHSTGTGTLAAIPAFLMGRYPYTDDWYRYGDWARAGQGWMSLPQVLQGWGYETIMDHFYYVPGFYHLHTGFDSAVIGSATWFDLLNKTVFDNFLIATSLRDYVSPVDSGESSVEQIGTLHDIGYSHAEQYFQKQAMAGAQKPFFAYFQMIRPHYPYLGSEFMGTFLPLEEGLIDRTSQMKYIMKPYSPGSQPIIDKLRLRYDENILKADQDVSHLLETLQRLGLYDQSLIIITADHGTTFSGGFQGNYTPLLSAAEHSVPLLVKYPGQTERRQVSTLVSTLDIVPTVLDVIGAVYPADPLDGESLLTAQQDNDRLVYVRLPNEQGGGHTFAALHGHMKLVQRGNERFLFNLAEDPDEQVNLLDQCQVDGLQTAMNVFEQRMLAVQVGRAMNSVPSLIAHLPAYPSLALREAKLPEACQ